MTRHVCLGRRAFAAFAMAMLLLAAGVLPGATQSATVRLVIDYGDGAQKVFTALPWSKGATVLDAMNAAKAHPRGISFKHRGSGATAMLTEIDGVAGEGGGTEKKNWQFWVNTGYADRSFAVTELQPLDVVIWRFAAEPGK